MEILKICKFYHDSGSINMTQTMGYCDLDCDQTTCDGNIDLCKKTNALKTYLLEQIKKLGGLKWDVERNIPIS